MGITMPEWFNQISEIHEKGATHWERLNIGHRRLSNNSIAFHERPSDDLLHLLFLMIQLDGEPGFINMEEAGRRRDNIQGVNP